MVIKREGEVGEFTHLTLIASTRSNGEGKMLEMIAKYPERICFWVFGPNAGRPSSACSGGLLSIFLCF